VCGAVRVTVSAGQTGRRPVLAIGDTSWLRRIYEAVVFVIACSNSVVLSCSIK